MSGRPIPVPELVAYAATRKPQRVHEDDLWRDETNMARWNTFGGSQNIFPVAHAASGDWRWIVAMSRAWRDQGLWGVELGAPGFYFTGPVACLVVALRDARTEGDAAAIADLCAALRAVWAWEALTAVPWPRTSSTIIFGRPGAPQIFHGPGEVAYGYHGPTCAVAGDRWQLKGAEGVGTKSGGPEPGGYPDRDPHGGWLAWALDMPRRDTSGASAALRARKNNPRGYGPHNAMGHVLGVDDFEHPVPPEPFGLHAVDRAVLRRLVATGGTDRAALESAVAMVAAVPPRQGHRRTLRRTDHGVEHVVWRERSGNKPALVYARVTVDGRWTGVRPCFHRGVGANKGLTVEAVPGGLQMGCAEGERATVDRLEGTEVWRLEVDDGRLELFRGGGAAVVPPPPPPPPPGPPPKPPPAPGGRKARWSIATSAGVVGLTAAAGGGPLLVVAVEGDAATRQIRLRRPVIKESFTLTARANLKDPLTVIGAGAGVNRHLLETAAGPNLVVETKADQSPLHFIREHRR